MERLRWIGLCLIGASIFMNVAVAGADTAERRYDDPDFCRRLIDIFFQMVDGTYEGPMDLEYFPASRDLYRAAD